MLVEFFNDFFGFRFRLFGGSAQRCCGDAGELFGASGKDQLGKRLGESFFEGYRAGKTLCFLRPAFSKNIGDFAVGAVLQQTGEKQVACFQQCNILFERFTMLREQACGFEFQQGCGGDQKFTGFVECAFGAFSVEGVQVCEELVGDLCERHLGNVEFAARNQGQ